MNSISTLLRVSIGALLIPLLGAVWLTVLMVQAPDSPWNQPGDAVKERLEHQLIFALSPLVEWTNHVAKHGPPDDGGWTTTAAKLLQDSAALNEVTWLISEHGAPRIFRQASRDTKSSFRLETMDAEIYQYVRNGQRPVAFTYASVNGPMFEFQAPLVSGNYFHGIMVARYSLPQLLLPVFGELPSHLSLVLWNRDNPLTEIPAVPAIQSTFVPFEAWGKKLTAEVRSHRVAPGKMIPLQWIGFISCLLLCCACVALRTSDGAAPFTKLSPDWFPEIQATSADTHSAPKPASDAGKAEPLPVWAIAQQERIQSELKKSKN